jgi:alkylated DNA repair dioxygenase AlkB
MLPPVPGLRYVPDFLDAATHDRLLAAVDAQPWQRAGGRSVQVYGYSYNHAMGGIYRIGDLPEWLAEVGARLRRDGLMIQPPDQVVVNAYEPGTGIFAHVDLVAAFDEAIVCISLGSTCVMEFTEPDTNRVEEAFLEPRSALVLAGEARLGWKHGIPARASDVWMGRDVRRGRRVSLTFRTMLVTSGTVPAALSAANAWRPVAPPAAGPR